MSFFGWLIILLIPGSYAQAYAAITGFISEQHKQNNDRKRE